MGFVGTPLVVITESNPKWVAILVIKKLTEKNPLWLGETPTFMFWQCLVNYIPTLDRSSWLMHQIGKRSLEVTNLCSPSSHEGYGAKNLMCKICMQKGKCNLHSSNNGPKSGYLTQRTSCVSQ